MRQRSYSYSPSPPRGYGRRGRNPSRRSRGRDLRTRLLVRNLHHDCRPVDLRRMFERFGPLKDVHVPRDYHTGGQRGFGFVQFVDRADAEEAKHQMEGQIVLGHELTIVFAEENRKKPSDMRAKQRIRSVLPDNRRYHREQSLSHSPYNDDARSRSRSRSRNLPVEYSAMKHPHRERSLSLSD